MLSGYPLSAPKHPLERNRFGNVAISIVAGLKRVHNAETPPRRKPEAALEANAFSGRATSKYDTCARQRRSLRTRIVSPPLLVNLQRLFVGEIQAAGKSGVEWIAAAWLKRRRGGLVDRGEAFRAGSKHVAAIHDVGGISKHGIGVRGEGIGRKLSDGAGDDGSQTGGLELHFFRLGAGLPGYAGLRGNLAHQRVDLAQAVVHVLSIGIDAGSIHIEDQQFPLPASRHPRHHQLRVS